MNCWLLRLIVALIHMEEFASVDLDVPIALSTHNTALDDCTTHSIFCFAFFKAMQTITYKREEGCLNPFPTWGTEI